MSHEHIFTEFFLRNSWGSAESVSGISATLSRTESIRQKLPAMFQTLGIQSIVDIGCGDWNWMRHVDLSGISYLGIDIVEPLVEQLQSRYTNPTIRFQKTNVLEEPPETADLWIVRDFCGLYGYDEIKQLFQQFISSESRFIAITSIDACDNQDSLPGTWRALNLRDAPFNLPEPVCVLDDGQQWFRNKKLLVFSSGAIEEWFPTMLARLAIDQPNNVTDTQDRNAHLVSNVPLRQLSLRVHRE
jgi:hypothetical protein